MNVIRIFAGIAIFILGLYAGWTAIAGLGSGEIVQLSKHGSTILHKALEPSRFWIAIVFWTIASVMLIGGGINMIRKNLYLLVHFKNFKRIKSTSVKTHIIIC